MGNMKFLHTVRKEGPPIHHPAPVVIKGYRKLKKNIRMSYEGDHLMAYFPFAHIYKHSE